MVIMVHACVRDRGQLKQRIFSVGLQPYKPLSCLCAVVFEENASLQWIGANLEGRIQSMTDAKGEGLLFTLVAVHAATTLCASTSHYQGQLSIPNFPSRLST